MPGLAANNGILRMETDEKWKLKLKFAMIGCDFIFPINWQDLAPLFIVCCEQFAVNLKYVPTTANWLLPTF